MNNGIITAQELKECLEKVSNDAQIIIRYGDELECELEIINIVEISRKGLINKFEISEIELIVDEKQYPEVEF